MWLFLSAPKREKPLSISQMQQEQKASTTSKSFFLGGGKGGCFFRYCWTKLAFKVFSLTFVVVHRIAIAIKQAELFSLQGK